MLICRDDDGLPWPPLGAIGSIDTELDKYSEYDVGFPSHPCPIFPKTWVVHSSYIVPINDYDSNNSTEHSTEAENAS